MRFLDITGYTRLTQEWGDEAAADMAGQLSRLVQRTLVQHGGRAVKWLGDGVMFHFPNPGPGVVAALDMVDGVSTEDGQFWAPAKSRLRDEPAPEYFGVG